jgi:D-alanyl-D-alanine carboxypeptidase/D-alanyl-D-alanine-endopeptidase (penicillin-binding protein 4)
MASSDNWFRPYAAAAGAKNALAALLCLTLPLPTAAQTASSELGARLSQFLDRLPADAPVSVVVADARTAERLCARQPDTPLKPASLMKLLVTAAALDRFGPGFEYRTRVYICHDEFWVIGAGDPALADPRIAERYGRSRTDLFDEWAEALHRLGIHRLGRIVLDDSVFDRQWRHPDWPIAEATQWYQAPVGGLNLNDNCLDAVAEPLGAQVRLTTQPELPQEFILTSLRPGPGPVPTVERDPEADVFRFDGAVRRRTEFDPVAVGNPTVFFGHALRHALIKRGIDVDGPVVRRALTPEATAAATLLAEHVTRLSDVLWRCNTFSQNLFAECLLKSLPAYAPDGTRTGQPGSWSAGTELVRFHLEQLGVPLDGAVLRDGSGLSHKNRLTAAQLVDLLIAMARHRHADEFIASLAAPGQEGSMRRRYDEPALRGRLRAKTGTLQGVRGLAGYAWTPDGQMLAFALLDNASRDADLPLKLARILVGANDRPRGN